MAVKHPKRYVIQEETLPNEINSEIFPLFSSLIVYDILDLIQLSDE